MITLDDAFAPPTRPHARNQRSVRELNIPAVIGHGGDRALLEQPRDHRARQRSPRLEVPLPGRRPDRRRSRRATRSGRVRIGMRVDVDGALIARWCGGRVLHATCGSVAG
ncbi:MAG: hypothetical protein EOP32_18955 [Rhodococcus sp. (in: high G+C Gram-positive bacteria)]|nr:MAG: hypothetical protein EOP32_18955 [Rhodococcus sp. (in: high G+C Gram-positive bacteria)]